MTAQHPFSRRTDPANLTRSALVVVDLQRLFTDPSQPPFVADAPAAVTQSLALLQAFRSVRRPVVFTRHAHLEPPTGHGMATWWSSFVMEGTVASQLDPRLQPADHELVVRKHHYSAFRETCLEGWLRDRNVDTVVLAGTMTHICVDTTARDSFMRGFDVVVVTDACASKHGELHESALDGLSHAVARLSTTDAMVAALAVVR